MRSVLSPPLPQQTATDHDVAGWLDQRARDFDDAQLSEMVGALGPVLVGIPELASDPDLVSEGDAATRELLGGLLEIPSRDGAAPSGALVSIVRTWARRGVDLRVL